MEEFPDEKFFLVQVRPWFADMANFKATRVIPEEYNWHQRKKLFKDDNRFIWDDPHLFKIIVDVLLKRCIFGKGDKDVLWHCNNSSYGGHYNGEITNAKSVAS